jgi:thioredoxin-like negative regulator of GroEL
MRRDPEYGDGAARKALLAAFESLAGNPLVGRYRRAMFAALH